MTGWRGEVAGDGGRLYEMRASDVPGYTKPPSTIAGHMSHDQSIRKSASHSAALW